MRLSQTRLESRYPVPLVRGLRASQPFLNRIKSTLLAGLGSEVGDPDLGGGTRSPVTVRAKVADHGYGSRGQGPRFLSLEWVPSASRLGRKLPGAQKFETYGVATVGDSRKTSFRNPARFEGNEYETNSPAWPGGRATSW